ncbi:hypothetical protein CFP66_05110 [Pseudonocardia sp. MH-G8]|nr:hypothetical protein CFP66_05110 [Pseudonocardia sp. MH-G8]
MTGGRAMMRTMTGVLRTAVPLAALTVLLSWLVLPADWSAVPTADPQTYASPVTAGHWTAAAVAVAVLAVAGGYASGAGAALLGVALPAVALYCYRSATAEVIGANLWPVGALFLTPPVVAGVAGAAVLGRAVRRRRERA